jgi:hypothetical protein
VVKAFTEETYKITAYANLTPRDHVCSTSQYNQSYERVVPAYFTDEYACWF